MDNESIYQYDSEWPIYAMDWSRSEQHPFRLGLGSYIESHQNYLGIVELNSETNKVQQMCSTVLVYPPTKLLFHPQPNIVNGDIIATTGDFLRLYSVDDKSKNIIQISKLTNQQSSHCAPLTSFDWNETDPNLIVTSSIDTTCTIWDLEQEKVSTQLIAHDKEVYDVAFSNNSHLFSTVGADGSVRMFDLRNLGHSTIMYESPMINNKTMPITRISYNKKAAHLLSCIPLDGSSVILIDVRAPNKAVSELRAHKNGVNAAAWSPSSSKNIATSGDDKYTFIWDISKFPVEYPSLAYCSRGPNENLKWSQANTNWLSVCYTYYDKEQNSKSSHCLELLRYK
eukprot:TRINITY_DN2544_c0_g2_i1.p1 TRINITY_DN2544_c0_g2~~TRINITY_DN2544_c0_g2_i1.p1  ORF type:complete len:359 (+),score=60.96 TRINITY_DN2544_c0_g2_i1:58-1077(+)